MTSAISTSPASMACRSYRWSHRTGADPAASEIGDEAFLEKEGGDAVMINSDFLDGMTVAAAKEEIAAGALRRWGSASAR